VEVSVGFGVGVEATRFLPFVPIAFVPVVGLSTVNRSFDPRSSVSE
jgi:hypothetical protein